MTADDAVILGSPAVIDRRYSDSRPHFYSDARQAFQTLLLPPHSRCCFRTFGQSPRTASGPKKSSRKNCRNRSVCRSARSCVSCLQGTHAANFHHVWSAGICVCVHDLRLLLLPERRDTAKGIPCSCSHPSRRATRKCGFDV